MVVGKTSLIPQAHILGSLVKSDTYTETGSVSNMTVASADSYSLELGTGVAASWEHSAKNLLLVPELRGTVTWDVLNDASESTTTGTSGTITSYTSQGATPAALGVTLGGGLGVSSDDKLTNLTLNYDANLKSDYVAHSGSLKLRHQF
jgi:hypothetical protein